MPPPTHSGWAATGQLWVRLAARRPPPAARSLTTHAVHVLSRFDASLRARDPRWGIRDVAALDGFGAPALRRVGLDEMPANNFLAVWERQL